MIERTGDACCGCRACCDVCPVSCITYTLDGEGFYFPSVDSDECIQCGKCEFVCPALRIQTRGSFAAKGFASYACSDETRREGASGGIFETLAQRVIEAQGIVFGAAFDQELKLVSTSAETLSELEPLCKSKYVQCNTQGVYKKIQTCLTEGRLVLFCSTPCNVSALKNFLVNHWDNLITMDFVCHGVPGQQLFDQCIQLYEKKKKLKVKNFIFRVKLKNGATPHYFRVEYIKGKKLSYMNKLYNTFPYYIGFQKYMTLRKSCYHCKYSTIDRVSDISVGDFHEINKYYAQIDRMKGVSMVICNTQKGLSFFLKSERELWVRSMDLSVLAENNDCLLNPTVPHKSRAAFFDDKKKNGLESAIKKYLNPKKEWSRIVYYKLPKVLREIAKNVLIGD